MDVRIRVVREQPSGPPFIRSTTVASVHAARNRGLHYDYNIHPDAESRRDDNGRCNHGSDRNRWESKSNRRRNLESIGAQECSARHGHIRHWPLPTSLLLSFPLIGTFFLLLLRRLIPLCSCDLRRAGETRQLLHAHATHIPQRQFLNRMKATSPTRRHTSVPSCPI
jgi:hypothetical protein